MPRNILVPQEDLQRMEEGGGLCPVTVKDRERHYKYLLDFLSKETGGEDIDVGNLLVSEDGRDQLANLIGRFFFSMRVEAADDGTEKLPKRKYAEKIRSSIKCTIQNLYRVDITDPCLFPQASKKWKAFIAELVANNRSEVDHHEEIDPVTVELIYDLLGNVKVALEARGTEEYEKKLSLIPAKLHDKLNYVMQWGAELCLEMYEIRRGGENLEILKKKDFKIIEDNIFTFKYIRKVVSEKEKCAPEGSNSSCHGVIPYIDMTPSFNPGEFVAFYMSWLPDESTKEGVDGGFMFPRPRKVSSKFKIHDPQEMKLFEPNMKVGKTLVYLMLPNLCDAVERPRQTNHSIRATAIMYLRRAGLPWETIIKVTGHKSTVTLVKNYDLKLEAPGLAEIAQAIGTGPAVAMGAPVRKTQLVPRKRKRDVEVLVDAIEIDEAGEIGGELTSKSGSENGGAGPALQTCSEVVTPPSALPGNTAPLNPSPVCSPYPEFSGQAVTSPGFSGHPVTSLNTSTGNPGRPVTTPDFSTYSSNPFHLGDNLLPAHSSHLGQIGAMAMASMAKSIMEGAQPMLHTLLLANMQVTRELSVKTGDGEYEKTVKMSETTRPGADL